MSNERERLVKREAGRNVTMASQPRSRSPRRSMAELRPSFQNRHSLNFSELEARQRPELAVYGMAASEGVFGENCHSFGSDDEPAKGLRLAGVTSKMSFMIRRAQ